MSPSILRQLAGCRKRPPAPEAWRVKRETCEKSATWADWIPTRLARSVSLARPYEREDCDELGSQ
jgi:hypothetical protein